MAKNTKIQSVETLTAEYNELAKPLCKLADQLKAIRKTLKPITTKGGRLMSKLYATESKGDVSSKNIEKMWNNLHLACGDGTCLRSIDEVIVALKAVKVLKGKRKAARKSRRGRRAQKVQG